MSDEKNMFVSKTTVENQKKSDRKIISPDGLFDLSALTKKQLKYWRMIYPTEGVLILYSEPGIAKSATLRELAKKVIYIPTGKHLRYIDLRLSMLDETDVGLFPDKGEYTFDENGEMVTRMVLDHIAPRWAYLSNEAPTLIHFEELNRAPLAVRNAALQILLEREIGYDFKFNKNVFMVASGNLGDEDGTDVEEFDSALNGRLIHFRHTLTLNEWIEYYANDNIEKPIINYLEKHIDKFYVGIKARKEGETKYASPRTWTFLSKYITANYGKYDDNGNYIEPMVSDWIDDVAEIADSYIGATASNFIKYLNDLLKISIHDILNRYSEIKSDKIEFTRDKKSELLHDLRKIDIKMLKDNQLEHIKMFILDLQQDETTSYLLYLMDDEYVMDENDALDKRKNKFILSFLKNKKFKVFQKTMLDHIEDENKSDSDDVWD